MKSHGFNMEMRQVAGMKMRLICATEKMDAIFTFFKPKQN